MPHQAPSVETLGKMSGNVCTVQLGRYFKKGKEKNETCIVVNGRRNAAANFVCLSNLHTKCMHVSLLETNTGLDKKQKSQPPNKHTHVGGSGTGGMNGTSGPGTTVGGGGGGCRIEEYRTSDDDDDDDELEAEALLNGRNVPPLAQITSGREEHHSKDFNGSIAQSAMDGGGASARVGKSRTVKRQGALEVKQARLLF